MKKTKKNKYRPENPYVSDSNRKLTITVDWNSYDNGYKDLCNERVLKFLTKNIGKGYNLIQTQPNKTFVVNKKTKIYLQCIKLKSWKRKTCCKWKKNDKPKIDEKEYLDCYNYNEWIKTTPCVKGLKRNKLFAKLKSNTYIGGFGTYLWRMFSGEITPEKHKEFVKVLKKTFTNNPVFIHNTDVDWFHIKEKI